MKNIDEQFIRKENNIACLVDHQGKPCPGYPEPKNQQAEKECTQECWVLGCRKTKYYPMSGHFTCKCFCHHTQPSEDKPSDQKECSEEWCCQHGEECKKIFKHGKTCHAHFKPSSSTGWEERFDIKFDGAKEATLNVEYLKSLFHKEIQEARREVVEEIRENVEQVFDNFRSSNIKDENGERVFGVADFDRGYRQLHEDILEKLK